ncbi:ATP-binding cassette domain-containing protein, partial [Micromonospora aurantiaca]|nr:ATP-binding cassette domain-containing protein [Micromonospora aurantiaca]
MEVPALRGASFTVAAGELVAIKGRSGSGKTTLLNLIGGLDAPDGGTVRVDGREVGSLPEDDLLA